MFRLEAHVDPLFRAPLALAIGAASAKLVATAWVMDEPLLKTSGALQKESKKQVSTQVVRLFLRAVFLGLAMNTLVEDAAMAMSSLAQFEGLQKLHALALVLAFSPNTVAAVSVAWMVEVKLSWTHAFFPHRDPLSMLADLLALVYCGMLGFIYFFPLFFFGTTHGILGASVLFYALAYDLVSLPWRLLSGQMEEIWIAVPFVIACAIAGMLYTAVMICYYYLVKTRYPHVAQQVRREGRQDTILKEQMPHHVAARIIGLARDGGLSKIGARSPKREPISRGVEMEAMYFSKSPEVEDDERCILNDEGLMLACGGKVLLCLSMPIVQLCVVIASQVYLGTGIWAAASASFQERTWAHYAARVSQFGEQRPLSLLWMYV
mmetsp:Transcript_73003/g.171132  ORF Transcript_73003/g.171132 Transcript_73003/m.171132 type:complete len:378 (+) Transcript_73003:33-1166(+)